MDLIPFELFGLDQSVSKAKLTVLAEVQREPGNLSLVLDFSDSMNCPTQGACECKGPSRTVECDELAATRTPDTQRVQELRTAVATFLDQFDPTYDRVNFVPFNIRAKVEVGLPASGSTFNRQDIIDAVDAEDPSSSTNLCDGMMTAYEEYADKGTTDVTYVVFSDGAPTAARLLFSSSKTNMESNDQGLGGNDYLSFAVAWQDDANNRWEGPSTLVKTDSIGYGYDSTEVPVGPAGQYIPTCAYTQSSEPQVPSNDTNKYDAVFGDCMNDMGFHMPRNSTLSYGSDIRTASESTSGKTYELNFREQYYNCAISLGDFLRSEGGSVYTVGLGEGRNLSTDIGTGDPYQDADDVFARKDFFLTRVSYDVNQARPIDENEVQIVTEKHPDFDFQASQDYDDLLNLPVQKVGDYYATPDATKLESIFKAIAQKTLLRLVK